MKPRCRSMGRKSTKKRKVTGSQPGSSGKPTKAMILKIDRGRLSDGKQLGNVHFTGTAWPDIFGHLVRFGTLGGKGSDDLQKITMMSGVMSMF